MSVILLKSPSSFNETLMKLDYSSFINEFKHSLKLTKSFNSLSIVNLALLSSLLSSLKLKTFLR